MGHVRDMWTDPPPAGAKKRTRNERWGRGKRWLARWDEAGTPRSKTFVTKDEATAWVAKRDAGVPVRTSSSESFRALAEAWRTGQVHHRDSTSESVSSALGAMILPTLGDRTLSELDRAVLQAAVGEWAQRWSPARVRVAWSYVTSILTQAELDGLIEARPKGIKLPSLEATPIVPLTVAQVQRIAGAVPSRWRSMVVVGAATGLRSGELRGLTRDRIVGGVLIVDRQLVGTEGRTPIFGPPKTPSSRRRLTLGKVAGDLLEEMRPDGAGGELVWRTRMGTPLRRTASSQIWRDAIVGMGLRERSGWHELRHHHASLLIAAGLSVRAVADRLGHKDPAETLRTYSHLWPTDDARAVAAIDQALASLASSHSGGAGTALALRSA